MPEESKEKAKKEATVEKASVKQEPHVREEMTVVKSSPPWPLITIGVFVTVVLLAISMIGWVFVASLTHGFASNAEREYGTMRPERGFGYNEDRMYGRDDSGRRGGLGLSVANGVVTKIDGDTITVSGQGKQVAVTKTDDTIISGNKQSLAVNDTVIVMGDTEEDDSVTATRIIVRNESLEGGRGEFEALDQILNI